MKKNILFGFAACGAMLLSANTASAQEVAVEEVVNGTETVECVNHYYSERNANWFLQFGAGMELPITDRVAGDHHRHITAAYNLGFGKWFSPYLAWRVSANYAAYHVDVKGYNKAKYLNANADIMWDMFNSFGVNTHRVFSIVPFAGIGVSRSWGWTNYALLPQTQDGEVKGRIWEVPVSVGLQFRFRLCKYVDFFAEGRYSFMGDEFDGVPVGQNVDMNLTAIGGFNINFGGRNFKSFNPCKYLDYINQLNGQVNDLRGALATCGAALAAAEAQLPCPEVVAPECPDAQAPLMSTVRFTINSAKITSTETVNVYNTAQWMKANPDSKVVVKGYADKNTGTAEYNMKLSERRAQAVYDMLTNEYGISADRLTIKAEGSDAQVYDENNWNRIVIFSQD
jgi:outer membrane protein OmpA-like peptidoglycan-associated protein